MSRIRSRGNATTEIKFMAILRNSRTTGWRRHIKAPGTPDFAFPNQKVAIFLNGCFWHGCPRCYKTPRSNTRFWSAKVATNRRRDNRVARLLRQNGWSVITIWEHDLLRKERHIERRITRPLQGKQAPSSNGRHIPRKRLADTQRY